MLITKVCEFCGEEFQTTSGTKKFCDRPHFDTCIVCGERFEVPYSRLGAADRSRTCSAKCRKQLRQETCLGRYGGVAPAASAEVQAKMKATTFKRYGVEHGAQSEAAKEKTKQTTLERYGVEYYTQTDEYKQQMQKYWNDDVWKANLYAKSYESYRQQHGEAIGFANPEIQDKIRQTCLEKYGQTSYSKTEEFLQKISATNQQKYGVDYTFQSEEIRNKGRQTSIQRYGTEYPMQNPAVLEKTRTTNLEKYGSENYMTSEAGRQKFAQAMKDKYGVSAYSQTSAWKAQRMSDPTKLEEFLAFDLDPKDYIKSHWSEPPSLLDVCAAVGVGTEAVGLRLQRAHCVEMVAYVLSTMEHEVLGFLKSIVPETEIIVNTKQVITPYELDIYLPQYKLGIECNPTSTHNSSINVFDHSAAPTAPSYHAMKSKLCEDKGIFLYHIFGPDWTHRRPVIESMLKNILGASEQRVYARKTEVKDVDATIAYEFLEKNHRQGGVQSKIRLGLYYQDELVALMTFGAMRGTIGADHTSENCYELVRFCNKLDTNVVGGASKLFKHFLTEYRPDEVRSFSDIAHTRGNLYRQLGFSQLHTNQPGYVWVDSLTDIAYHRVNAQKQNLKKFLKDDSIDLNQTEREIMIAHGFLQLYDSGTITWTWTK